MFRTSYAIKMTEIIEQCEKNMKLNVEAIADCITEFANINKVHNEELGLHIEKLSKVRIKIVFITFFRILKICN